MGIWAAVKYALNSTLGTSNFLSLDKMIQAHGTQTFTSNGTFTVPAGVTKIWVTACGGGQAGSSGDYSRSSSGKGGAGGDCIFKKAFSVTPGQEISIIVGKGGTTSGTIGNATVIGSLVTLAGGNNNRENTNGGGLGGMGGYSKSPNIYAESGKPGLIGLGGVPGYRSDAQYAGGGGGGSLGDGGRSGSIIDNRGQSGKPGQLGGGGGGGTSFNNSPDGGNGGDGIVIIEW